MTTLCNRCELLFGACRPLLGAACPLSPSPAAAAHEYDYEPDTLIPARPAAAIVAVWKTGRAHLTPIAVADFYEGRPSPRAPEIDPSLLPTKETAA